MEEVGKGQETTFPSRIDPEAGDPYWIDLDFVFPSSEDKTDALPLTCVLKRGKAGKQTKLATMGKETNGWFVDRQEDAIPVPRNTVFSFQTETVIDGNTYTISQSGDKSNPSLKVQIFTKKTAKWITPIVLGEISVSSKGHVAMLVDKDRIMIVLMGAPVKRCTWFLEVDTPYVKEQKKIHGTEVVAWSKGVPSDGPKPVIIAGPSGVGKGTLIGKLMEEFPSTFGFSVSHTTRLPREKEKNGVHYHFTKRNLMEKDIKDGKFLEFASVHGNLYGTSIEAVEEVADGGKRCILDIDIQGSRSVRASSLDAVFIFIAPPSYEELEKRLRGRRTETEEQVQKRLRNAILEIEQGKSPGLFDHVLINDDLEVCYENLKKILGLEVKSHVPQSGSEVIEDPVCHLTLRSSYSYTLECENNSLFFLDVSSIKGGAPRRTRGLTISPLTF